jgi:protein SCO1/2
MKSRIFASIIVLLAAAAIAWLLLSQTSRQHVMAPSAPPATVFADAFPVTGFSLVDFNNQPFTPDSLKGTWTFMFFGYTHCPDICPNTMQVFKLMQENLAGKVDDVRFVFVSVDPDRDNPENLKEYTGYFHPDFIGVTGSHPELTRLTRQVGILYIKGEQSDDGKNYLVDHSAAIVLIDPMGMYRALYSAPHDPVAMSESFLEIHKFYQEGSKK